MRNLPWSGLLIADLSLFLAQYGRDGAWQWRHALLPLLFTLALALFYLVLDGLGRDRPRDDMLLAALTLTCGLGLSAIARLGDALAHRQLLWLIGGLVIFVLVSARPIARRIQTVHYGWALVALALLVVTALFGVEVGGAKSWVRIAGLQFQPLELVKILIIFFLAAHLSVEGRLWPMLTTVLLAATILIAQRDLGGALLIFALFITIGYAATGNVRYLTAGLVSVALFAGAATLLFDHVRTRFLVWIDPWSLSDGQGRQIIEALFSVGAGGFWGTGWGRGLAERIPVVETDFIFALITEELGFLGAAALLFLLAVVCVRSMRPALDRHRPAVERIVAVGVGLSLALQSGLIVAGVTRLLPVTGVTLPLVSYGGSSLVASLAQIGLAYNLIRHEPAVGPDDRPEGDPTWSRA